MEEEIEELLFCWECRHHYLVRSIGKSETCKCEKINLEKPYVSKSENESTSEVESNNERNSGNKEG